MEISLPGLGFAGNYPIPGMFSSVPRNETWAEAREKGEQAMVLSCAEKGRPWAHVFVLYLKVLPGENVAPGGGRRKW